MFRGTAKNKKGYGGDERRGRAPRHKVDALSCNLGPVLDLSTSGMRIATNSKPPLQVGQTVKLKLRIPEGSLPLAGQVVWIKRAGLKKYQVGVRFVNLKRSTVAALDLLGRFGFLGVGEGGSFAPPTLEGETSEPASGFGGPQSTEAPSQDVIASIELPDYYDILNIGPLATEDEIRMAFRQMARRYHPDASGSEANPDRFLEIREAYGILRDPESRKTYDLRQSA